MASSPSTHSIENPNLEEVSLFTQRYRAMQLALTLAACLPNASATQSPRPQKRTWLKGSWTVLANLTSQSGAIGRSDLTAVTDSSLYVYDYQDHVLKAFTLAGQPKWRFGTDGMRAGEFHVVTSLDVDARGQIWASDPIVRRVTIVSPSGQLVRTIDGLQSLWRVVPRSDGAFWGWAQVRQTNGTLRGEVRLYDSTGAHFSRVSISPVLDTVNTFAGVAWLCSIPADGLAVTYFWSDRFAFVGGTDRKARLYRGIERREFPSLGYRSTALTVGGNAVAKVLIDSTAKLGGISGSVDGDRLYVLFGTGPRTATNVRRTVDTYRLSDGRYMGSYLMPEDATRVLVRHGVFIASVDKPAPAVKLWKWTPKP